MQIKTRIHYLTFSDFFFPGINEKNLESLIADTVQQLLLTHLHPKAAIVLTIQEMQSSGLVGVAIAYVITHHN